MFPFLGGASITLDPQGFENLEGHHLNTYI